MRIERCGDRAFLIRLGDRPHPPLSRRIAALQQRLAQAQPAGLDDVVAGFVTLLIMYDPDVTTAEALCDMAEALLPKEDEAAPRRTWTLPVCYDASVAPKLPDVAAATGLTGEEIARLHAARRYTVYLIGFSPGFPYMGNVDARLTLPRRADPRPRVPAGSVAIATTYTAVYPQDTAGGWHLIGRTPVRLFDAGARSPALLSPGDEVCFSAVTLQEYDDFMRASGNRDFSRSMHRDARMTTLRIVRAGIHATVQDTGRSGYRALGVPGSGALDAVTLHLANAVVGNSAGTAAVEILYSGMTVEVADGSARIAVGGASAVIERNDQSIALPAWQSAVVHAGDRVRIAAPVQTAAAYLAVEGGYAIPHVLGSASTYVQGRVGGYEGRALRAGDELALSQAQPHAQCERRYRRRCRSSSNPGRCASYPVRKWNSLSATRSNDCSSSPYRVTPASNRSGLRLEGAALEHVAGHDLLSEGVATGSIQVPGSGQPVLLIGDHPTVGGYPKIATIISADLPAAGRLRIGSSVHFELASEQQAASARHAQRAWIAERLAALQSIA